MAVTSHGSEESQWITDQELEKDTCNHKITVKHIHDPSIEMGEKVYPFNASKKLYQVNGEYVKASCGGENILEIWDGKKDNECLMIDNVEEEKIKQEYNYYEEFSMIDELEIYCHAYKGEQGYNIWPGAAFFFDYVSNKWYNTELILKTSEERLNNAKELILLATSRTILLVEEAVTLFLKYDNWYKKIEYEIIFSEPICTTSDYAGVAVCYIPHSEIKVKVWM